MGDLPYFWAFDVFPMLVGSVLVLWVGFALSERGREGERERGREGRREGKKMEGNMAQVKEACLGLPEDALPTHCSSDPHGRDTDVLSFPGTLYKHDLQRALDPERRSLGDPWTSPVLMLSSSSLGGQCQAWGDAVSQNILVHKIWKHESMNCNRA